MTWASLATRIGGLAILVPVVVTRLSAPEVLVWQMLSTITLLTSLADFGFSPTFARIIAFARGGGTLSEMAEGARGRIASPAGAHGETVLNIPAVLAAQASVYRRLILLAVALTAIGGTAVLLRPIGGLAQPIEGWQAWAFSALAGLFILGNGANVAVLTGFDRIALSRRLDAFLSALQLASTCVVALAGLGLVAIVACYSVWTVPLYLANRWNARRVAAAVAPQGTAPDPVLLAEIWRSAWRSGLGILMSTGIIQASGLIYAQVAAPADAAAYLLLLRGMTAASQLSQAPFYSRLPRMAQLRGQGRIDEVAQLATRGMAMAFWTFVVTALGLLLVAPPVLQAIGSSVAFPAPIVSLVLVAAFFVERYCAMHIQIYSLTHHIIWHLMNGISGVLMVVFGLILFPLMGQIALPLAMLLGYCSVFAWYGSRRSLQSLNAERLGFEVRTSIAPALLLAACLTVSVLSVSR